MNIQKVKTKNTTFYYLNKSYRDVNTGRPCSKILERLGSREDLIKKLGKDCDIDKWLQDYAKKRTREENKKNQDINLSIHNPLKRNNDNRRNIGYLFFEKICYQVGLDKICKKIEKKENLDFNLFDIMSCAVYRGLLDIDPTGNFIKFSKRLLKPYDFKKENVSRALKAAVKNNAYIQKSLYKNISKLLNCDNSELFYTCSNYSLLTSSFEYVKYNKKVADNLTLIKLFFDGNNIPCGLIIDSDFFDCIDDNKDILSYIKYKFNGASLYVLPESVFSKTDKKLARKFKNNATIKLRYGSTLSKEDYKWAINPDGWYAFDSGEMVNLKEINEKFHNGEYNHYELSKNIGTIFTKHKEVFEEDEKTGEKIKKTMYFAYNYETWLWLTDFKLKQLRLFQQSVEEKITKASKKLFQKKGSNNFLRVKISEDQEKVYYFNDSPLFDSTNYEGYNMVCEPLDADTLFKILKTTYFKYNFMDTFFHDIVEDQISDKNISYKETIIVNFLMVYIETSIFKVLEHYLNLNEYRFWEKDILSQLNAMDLIKVDNDTWVPVYSPTELTDALHELFGFNTDYNILTDQALKRIIKNSM